MPSIAVHTSLAIAVILGLILTVGGIAGQPQPAGLDEHPGRSPRQTP